MAIPFVSGIAASLDSLGFYGFVLPWLLVFGLVYGLIKKLNLFGDTMTPKVGGIIAVAMAFFVTAYTGIGTFFVGLSGISAMLLVALLFVIIVFGFLGFSLGTEEMKKNLQGWTVIAMAIVAIIVFLFAGTELNLIGLALSSDMMAGIFILLVIAMIFVFVVEPFKKKEAQAAPPAGEEKKD